MIENIDCILLQSMPDKVEDGPFHMVRDNDRLDLKSFKRFCV